MFTEPSCDPLMEAERQICTRTASSVQVHFVLYLSRKVHLLIHVFKHSLFWVFFHILFVVSCFVRRRPNTSSAFRREALAGKVFVWFMIL